MTLIHDFKKGQKKFKRDDFQKLGRAAKQILNMSVGRGLNRIETRFGSAIWPTRQKKQDASPAASGAVQPFIITPLESVHPDLWRCIPLTEIPPTFDASTWLPLGNPIGGTVWVAKPPNLRATGLYGIPINFGGSNWYRYEQTLAHTYEYRSVFKGASFASQTTLIRTERMNPGITPHIPGNSFLPVGGAPQTYLYRWYSNVVIFALNATSGLSVGGESVDWIDMNINARHWARQSTLTGDDLPEDVAGVF